VVHRLACHGHTLESKRHVRKASVPSDPRDPGSGDRLFYPALARAIPAFAQQTGQPCTACHIGAFGPQLTAFGRAFKISGYTQTGGDATVPIPLSLMLLGSYSNTTKGQGGPAANNYGANGNFAMDQISLFLRRSHQRLRRRADPGTFDGIASAFIWTTATCD
jgi:hypothetical protein